MREDFMNNVFENYERQIYDDKELIIVLTKSNMNIANWLEKANNYENVRVFQLNEVYTLGDSLNFAIEKSVYDYFAKFDDDDYYGPFYLKNSMDGFIYPNVSIVGKNSFYMYIQSQNALILVNDVQHAYTNWVAGATLVVKKEVFNQVRFRSLNLAEDSYFVQDCNLNGLLFYAIDNSDFVAIRRNPIEHTWDISDERLMNWGKLVAVTDDYVPIVSSNPKD
jgi:cellulose synthase/poly-beta-1,6-N-acetylglucosamine synthase-like glycosyltransferase